MNLCVIVPSRGRPENARRLIDAWRTVTTKATLIFALDEDDPTRDEYLALPFTRGTIDENKGPAIYSRTAPRTDRRMAGALNVQALELAHFFDVLGFMGDDHLPKTAAWDEIVIGAIEDIRTGVVYGNDLLQGANLPTQVFMTSNIVKTLGYIVPDGMTHMYLDNTWKDWGLATELRYLPDVIIEHLHPVAGKAEGDDGYAEADSFMEPDRIAYENYKATTFFSDRAKLRTLITGKAEG